MLGAVNLNHKFGGSAVKIGDVEIDHPLAEETLDLALPAQLMIRESA